MEDASERLRSDEGRVVGAINRLLQSWQLGPLCHLSQLYNVDETFLTTLPELDHYPNRDGATYWGVWSRPGGAMPHWPTAGGKKIFAYLKPFRGLAPLLERLKQSGCPAVIYLDRGAPSLAERFQSPTLHFSSAPLDLSVIAAQCDLAILNGGHGAATLMLLAGKPMLLIPLYLEQALTAAAVTRMGAGLSASPNQPDQVVAGLETLIDNDQFASAARLFAERYATYNPTWHIERIVHRIEELT
jgi:UDP:flavonoid glycosyltransferase YjiC (YdhE family)